MAQRRWRDLSGGQRAAVLALGAVQLALAVTAWRDLARRSPAEVAGRKGVWAAVIAVDWVGPLAWFRWGRRR
ncbi:PLDc N-terminal domain-containing protein [Geodermatophilus sp. SYSU D01186]